MSADAQLATQTWSMGREQRLLEMRDRLQKVRDAERARMGRDALVQAAAQLDPTSPTFLQDRQRVLANNLEAATLDPVGQAAANLGVDAYQDFKSDNIRRENREWQHEDRDEAREFNFAEEMRKKGEMREERQLENPMLWEAAQAILLDRPELIDEPDLVDDLARQMVQDQQLSSQLISMGVPPDEIEKKFRRTDGRLSATRAHQILSQEKYFKSVGDRVRQAEEMWREEMKEWREQKKEADKLENEMDRLKRHAELDLERPMRPSRPSGIPAQFLPPLIQTAGDVAPADETVDFYKG